MAKHSDYLNWRAIGELYETVASGQMDRADNKNMGGHSVRCYSVPSQKLIRIDIVRHDSKSSPGGNHD